MRATINIITQKEVVRIRDISANPKQLKYIIKLSVDVSHKSDGRIQFAYIIFFRTIFEKEK